MTNSLAVPSEDTMSTTNPYTLNRRSPAQRLELNDRRRSNRSTYVERSLFGTAIESLFGKDSIFGALDKPLEESTPSSPQQEGVSMQTGKLAGQSLKRKHSSSETLGSDASNFKAFRTALLPPPSPEGDHNYKKYTLVLDLDETLVHFEHRKMVYKVRPLCIRFLTDMAKLFEIVIFTAAH
jgi:TFIIF-interacting CTD phosphatase-like protein